MKTGTTTLQDLWRNDPRVHQVLHSRFFNTERFETIDYWKEYGWEVGKVVVESDENITRKYKNMIGLEESLKRIQSVAPDAKIVLTVRHPKGMLLSMYKHIIRQTFSTDSMDAFIDSKEGQSFIQTLRYGDELETILNYFPREKVFVYKQEDFRAEPKAFLERIYQEVLEISYDDTVKYSSINVGRNDREIRFKKVVNHLNLSKKHNKLFFNLTKLAYKLAGNSNKRIYTWSGFSQSKDLEADFNRSNAKFAELYGEDLNYTF